MICQVAEKANARDLHVRSIVDQMLHLGSYKHLGCNEQGLHHVGITLCVASMQRSIRLPKVLAKFTAERASCYILLDEVNN